MTEPVDPTAGAQIERRAKQRRGKDRRSADRRAGKSGLPVPVSGPVSASQGGAAAARGADAAFTAQMLGQTGQKRGLKGGPPVLEAAKTAYLDAEWSGAQDRRRRTGKIAKKEI
jgi:hypothetical protein